MGHWGRIRPEVFPTCVGVFLCLALFLVLCFCLPHVRGGVSQAPELGRLANASSPRAWGCFYEDCEDFMDAAVFPTCVGVFLPRPARVSQRMCLPHVRGGVSIRRPCFVSGEGSSPRAWGCFFLIMKLGNKLGVFPTCVGVFLWAYRDSVYSDSLPHVRGGVSITAAVGTRPHTSSPRAWGCFYVRACILIEAKVFPTCVGVFLSEGGPGFSRRRLPHVRGGVSEKVFRVVFRTASSPRAWGCF